MEIEVNETYRAQFCVIGGGMAGLCAAVAAARRGVKTALVQDRPVFGGNASGEVRMWIRGAGHHFPFYREGGIVEELAMANIRYNPTLSFGVWDGVLYDLAAGEKNLKVFLNATCTGAKEENGRILYADIWQLTTYKKLRIFAEYFADCSGDSILSYCTSAAFTSGREDKARYGEKDGVAAADGCTMGSSCLIQVRETAEKVPFTPPSFARKLTEEEFRYRMDTNSRGVFRTDNFWWMELGGTKDVTRDAEEIKTELLALAYGVWDYIKNSGKFDSDNWTLDWVSFLGGKRESRRYIGDYVLNENDLLSARVFGDEVAYGGWPMDDHNPAGFDSADPPNRNIFPKQPYGIPYRCLYSKNIENLFFAGRNVSVSHLALSSTRVMGTCAALGQAAGTACSLLVGRKKAARDVDIAALQQALRDDDCFLLNTPRRLSAAMAGAESSLSEGEKRILAAGVERKLGEEAYCIERAVGETLEFTFPKTRAGAVRIVFDNDIAREYCKNPWSRSYPMKLNISLADEQEKMPPSLVKAYRVETLIGGKWRTVREEKENYRRLVRIPVGGEIEGVRLTGLETYGAKTVRVISVDLVD